MRGVVRGPEPSSIGAETMRPCPQRRSPRPRRAAPRVAAGLAVLSWLGSSCDHGTSAPDGSPEVPTTQGHIGSARCSACHGPYFPAKVHGTYGEDWADSIHGATTQVTPSEQTIVADQDGNGSSDFLDGLDLASQPAWNRYTLAGGAFADLAPRLGHDAGSGAYRMSLGSRTFPVEQVLGVGRGQQTYLTRIGRSLYVLPARFDVAAGEWEPLQPENWYTWIDSDGDERLGEGETISGALYASVADTPVSLGRTADSWDRNCSGCHVTGLTAIEHAADGQFVADYAEAGIGCEACHGPGRLHDLDLGGQTLPDRGIVDPNHLAADRQRDLCMSCHTRGRGLGDVGGTSLPFPWHPQGGPFLPGESLADAFVAGADPDEALHALQGGQTHRGASGSTYGVWEASCQDCHSAHDSTNLSRVRAVIETPSSGPRPVVFTARSGAPGSGGLMGDATDGRFTDACEVCHTRTSHFRNDLSTPSPDHHNGQRCTECHLHERGFAPDGGECTDCHDRPQPPSGSYRRQVVQNGADGLGDFVRFSHHVLEARGVETVEVEDCEVCHDQSGHRGQPDPQVLLNDPDGGVAHRFDGTGASIEDFCLGCHDGDGLAGDLRPFSSGNPVTNVAAAWVAAPAHARAPGVSCWSCHRNGHGSSNPALGAALEENGCLACHDGTFGADVASDFARPHRHPVRAQSFVHERGEDLVTSPRHVECEDCHDPHAADGSFSPAAPAASGLLAGVGGVNGQGIPVFPVTNGYELCYRCHAETTPAASAFPRTLDESNVRVEFDPGRASFHPVEAAGRNPDVPSLMAPWTTGSVVTCWDCHAGSADGPHGSDFPWILKLRYDTGSSVTESAQAYALCYSCHSRASILDNDSFPRHRMHIVGERSPCSACHDPHGSSAHAGNPTGSHLINFRTDVVSPSGNGQLFFRDDGRFRGTCTLRCHGEGHSNEDY